MSEQKRDSMIRDKRIESFVVNATERHNPKTIMDDEFDVIQSAMMKMGEDVANSVKFHYEYLIDKGVLMVVKEVENSAEHYEDVNFRCSHCSLGLYDAQTKGGASFNYCPGCGGKIKNP